MVANLTEVKRVIADLDEFIQSVNEDRSSGEYLIKLVYINDTREWQQVVRDLEHRLPGGEYRGGFFKGKHVVPEKAKGALDDFSAEKKEFEVKFEDGTGSKIKVPEKKATEAEQSAGELSWPVNTGIEKIDTKFRKQPLETVSLDDLAAKILQYKERTRANITESMLELKWLIGQEITVARVQQDANTFRVLEEKTGIHYSELSRCVQFYEKYPKKDFEIKAWRKIIAELPAEATDQPKAEKKACPVCGSPKSPSAYEALREKFAKFLGLFPDEEVTG